MWGTEGALTPSAGVASLPRLPGRWQSIAGKVSGKGKHRPRFSAIIHVFRFSSSLWISTAPRFSVSQVLLLLSTIQSLILWPWASSEMPSLLSSCVTKLPEPFFLCKVETWTYFRWEYFRRRQRTNGRPTRSHRQGWINPATHPVPHIHLYKHVGVSQ